MAENEVEETLKILVIGDSGVGKSTFISMYCDDTFISVFKQTVGIDFRRKLVERNGKTITLQLWDTAGQERYRAMINAYYRGADGFVLMFDLTSMESFKNCEFWLKNIKENNGDESIVIALVGNKIDRIEELIVFDDVILDFSTAHNVRYFEISTKDNLNVNQVFEYITKACMETKQSPSTPPSIPLTTPPTIPPTIPPTTPPIDSKTSVDPLIKSPQAVKTVDPIVADPVITPTSVEHTTIRLDEPIQSVTTNNQTCLC